MLTIAEYREKHPQFSGVDDTTLAKAIHQKHYSTQSYDEFASQFMPTAKPAGLGDQFKAGVKDFLGNEKIMQGINAIKMAETIKARGSSGSDLRLMAPQGFGGTPTAQDFNYQQLQDLGVDALRTGADLKEAAAQVALSDETLSVLNSETFAEAWQKFKTNPVKVSTELTARSGANMVPIIAAGSVAGLLTGPVGYAVTSGVTSGRIEYVNSIVQSLQEAGVNLHDKESVINALKNTELMKKIESDAMKRGFVIGSIDTLTGGVASKTIAPGVIKGVALRQAINVPAQAAIQASGGSGGEALAQFATEGEIKPGEVVAEGLAELTTAPIDVVGATLSTRKELKEQAKQRASDEKMIGDIMDKVVAARKKPEEKADQKSDQATDRRAQERGPDRRETSPKYKERRELVKSLQKRFDEVNARLSAGEQVDPAEVQQVMSDLYNAAYYSPVAPNLQNKRGFEDFVAQNPDNHTLMMDYDDFKAKNELYGHSEADKLIAEGGLIMEAVAKEMGVSVFHRSGDEFLGSHRDPAVLKSFGDEVQKRLKESIVNIEMPDGSIIKHKGIGGSYGVGRNESFAEEYLKLDKERRKLAGERTGQRDTVRSASEGRQDQVNRAAEGKGPGNNRAPRVINPNLSPGEVLQNSVPEDFLEEKYARNINLNRIESTQDLDHALKNIAHAMSLERGGKQTKVTHSQIKREAKALGLTEKDVRNWARKDGITREMVHAARQILVESGNDLVSRANAALGGDQRALLEFKAALERHNAIMSKVSGMTAEAGRILNQFNMTAKASKGKLDAINIASENPNLKIAAAAIAGLNDPAKINEIAKKSFTAKAADVIIEAWINALLSGPQTHAANIISNTAVSWVVTGEAYLSAAISKVTGGQISFREAQARTAGWLEGILDVIQAANALRSNDAQVRGRAKDYMNDVLSSGGKMEQREGAISTESLGMDQDTIAGRAVNVAGKIIRTPGQLLQMEDLFFKAIGYRQEINALAMREALKEAKANNWNNDQLSNRFKELKANPTDEMKDSAHKAASYQTFTNKLGTIGQAVQQLANSSPWFKFIVPFVRTPINIIHFAGERSPIALLMKDTRDNLLGKGSVTREVAMARLVSGSMVLASAAYMSTLGLITGGGPDDPEEKAAKYRSGWQPYSIKIGDEYHSYSRLEPFSMLLGTMADAMEIWDKASKSERDEMSTLLVTSSVGSIGNNLLSKTWLRGLSDILGAIREPERYGERWWQSMVGTTIPTGVAQIARTNDPMLRRVDTITDAVKSRIPGKREELLPKLNLWGEPIKLGGSFGPDILSPVYTSVDKHDLVEDEMIRLEIFPRMPQEKLKGVELTPELHNEYIALAGAPAKQFLAEIVESEDYQKIPDFARKEIIETAVNKFRDRAGKMMLIKHPDIFEKSVEKKLEVFK